MKLHAIDVSAVIPTHDRAPLLGRAIRSILSQSLPVKEVIIVDDGSTDNTAAVVRSFLGDIPIRYVKTIQRGVSAARNHGIAMARGSWIALLDSDDEWLPNRLALQRELLCMRPDLQVVHGEEIWIRKGKRVNQMQKHRKCGGEIYRECLPLCRISPSAVLVRRDLLLEIGTFNEDFVVCEDYDLWLRIAARVPVGFVERPIIVKHGGHEDQLSARYVAMDWYRVKALDSAWQELPLSREDRLATSEEVLRKTRILMKGYEKYGRHTELEEVAAIAHRHVQWQADLAKASNSQEN